MQFKALALSALVASASAQSSAVAPGDASAASSINTFSIFEILATALPPQLVSEALAGSTSAVYKEIASEFAASTTPKWFTALPTPVQTYLLGTGAQSIGGGSNATMHSNHTTTKGGPHHHTPAKPTHGQTTQHHQPGQQSSSSAAAGSSSSSSSKGAAALPTVVSGGIIGAVGLVGLLAL